MATPSIVPNAASEGSVGTTLKPWGGGWFDEVYCANLYAIGVTQLNALNVDQIDCATLIRCPTHRVESTGEVFFESGADLNFNGVHVTHLTPWPKGSVPSGGTLTHVLTWVGTGVDPSGYQWAAAPGGGGGITDPGGGAAGEVLSTVPGGGAGPYAWVPNAGGSGEMNPNFDLATTGTNPGNATKADKAAITSAAITVSIPAVSSPNGAHLFFASGWSSHNTPGLTYGNPPTITVDGAYTSFTAWGIITQTAIRFSNTLITQGYIIDSLPHSLITLAGESQNHPNGTFAKIGGTILVDEQVEVLGGPGLQIVGTTLSMSPYGLSRAFRGSLALVTYPIVIHP